MSTPERDLEAYERENERADWLEAQAELESDDEQPSCSYCGEWIEDGDCHVIKGVARAAARAAWAAAWAAVWDASRTRFNASVHAAFGLPT